VNELISRRPVHKLLSAAWHSYSHKQQR